MDKWWKYINEDNPSYRNRIKTLDVDMGQYLDTGPQKKGSPYKTDRARFKKKKFNDISAPPGAPGGLEEEVEPASFEKQTEMAPRFWLAGKLNPKIARRLSKIANEFLEGLNIDVEMEDLRLTGSVANYNWSKYSDVDLHIVVDFSKIDENIELVKQFFDSARWRWNELHNITIYGHEVEIYIENVGHVTHSSGIYSIINNEWIIEPTRDKVEFDYPTARKKADAIETEVNLIEKFAGEKPRATVKSVDRLKEKIRRMRTAGLQSPQQEYSAENIAFKILRREETFDKLNNMKYSAYDRIMSI
tara:strand:+ start:1875 stop:2783 length:909 start_codon:yes stop_codon:yes gene_type:complete